MVHKHLIMEMEMTTSVPYWVHVSLIKGGRIGVVMDGVHSVTWHGLHQV